MIDIHSHVLPGIDDGSSDITMSLTMLKESRRQGVTDMFLTPHFYADMNDPQKFLQKRQDAAQALSEYLESNPEAFPRCILGAEVHYFRGIGKSEDISKLTLGRSRYILLEPTFRTWTPAFLEDVRILRDEQDLKVVIAHIERYLDQDKHLVRELLEEEDVYIQSNSEAFLERWSRKKVLKMLEGGKIHFLGSDCHNLTERRPNLRESRKVIEEKLGKEYLDAIDQRGQRLLAAAR